MQKINKKFSQNFNNYDSVPISGRKAVDRLMRNGKMFRYAGDKPENAPTLLMEHQFSEYVGSKYALGLNSCSSGILLALIACGLKKNDTVLLPAFTFTAVPSAIINAGGKAILVECNKDYRLDIDDLKKKAAGAKFLVLSYMRGHTSDVEKILEICKKNNIVLIEDAAHALGNRWGGRMLGTFGKVGVYSFQSNKIINAGEGGIVVTDDLELIVKMIYLSGAYEKLLDKHLLPDNPFIKMYRGQQALFNMRMTNITAEMVRSQLPKLEDKAQKYRKNYQYLVRQLCKVSDHIRFPVELLPELRVPDSIQFSINEFSSEQISIFVAHLKKYGFPISAFGVDRDNARAYWNWHYIKTVTLPETKSSLMTTCDMRLSSTLTRRELDYFINVVADAIKLCRKN